MVVRLRPSTVLEWTSTRLLTWDACSEFVVGAERARWEFVPEAEPMNLKGDRDDIDADVLVVDLARRHLRKCR